MLHVRLHTVISLRVSSRLISSQYFHSITARPVTSGFNRVGGSRSCSLKGGEIGDFPSRGTRSGSWGVSVGIGHWCFVWAV